MSAIRIVGGIWRRMPLPVVDRAGLRPTPDRVRETLFNWLGQRLDGRRVLDAFAGSGALGFEAASRGAAEVVMVENDRTAAAAISGHVARLRGSSDPASREAAARIMLRTDDVIGALRALAGAGRRFDLVLLDPPFGQGWLERVVPALPPVLADAAHVYVESEAPINAADLGLRVAEPGAASARSLETLRHGRAGQVHYHLLEYRLDNRVESR